ncbi:MAG: hypothetical protein NTV38_10580, partial [Chloroflexi bacterium]|nr:hypothetical protein [Chloroflexota bacterium]
MTMHCVATHAQTLLRSDLRGALEQELIQQPFGELQKNLHILEVAHQPHRNTHSAGGFAVNAQAEVIQAQALAVAGL